MFHGFGFQGKSPATPVRTTPISWYANKNRSSSIGPTDFIGFDFTRGVIWEEGDDTPIRHEPPDFCAEEIVFLMLFC